MVAGLDLERFNQSTAVYWPFLRRHWDSYLATTLLADQHALEWRFAAAFKAAGEYRPPVNCGQQERLLPRPLPRERAS
jgi:hypothetical protein